MLPECDFGECGGEVFAAHDAEVGEVGVGYLLDVDYMVEDRLVNWVLVGVAFGGLEHARRGSCKKGQVTLSVFAVAWEILPRVTRIASFLVVPPFRRLRASVMAPVDLSQFCGVVSRCVGDEPGRYLSFVKSC